MRKLPFLALRLLASVVSAQQKDGNLELRLHPEPLKSGIPQAFTFTLTNRSDHELRLPSPSLPCSDGLVGSISLHIEFTPPSPGPNGGISGGYAGDTLGWPVITQRINPGKSFFPANRSAYKAFASNSTMTTSNPGPTNSGPSTLRLPLHRPTRNCSADSASIFPTQVWQAAISNSSRAHRRITRRTD